VIEFIAVLCYGRKYEIGEVGVSCCTKYGIFEGNDCAFQVGCGLI